MDSAEKDLMTVNFRNWGQCHKMGLMERNQKNHRNFEVHQRFLSPMGKEKKK
jgi:hypothetical protein